MALRSRRARAPPRLRRPSSRRGAAAPSSRRGRSASSAGGRIAPGTSRCWGRLSRGRGPSARLTHAGSCLLRADRLASLVGIREAYGRAAFLLEPGGTGDRDPHRLVVDGGAAGPGPRRAGCGPPVPVRGARATAAVYVPAMCAGRAPTRCRRAAVLSPRSCARSRHGHAAAWSNRPVPDRKMPGTGGRTYGPW